MPSLPLRLLPLHLLPLRLLLPSRLRLLLPGRLGLLRPEPGIEVGHGVIQHRPLLLLLRRCQLRACLSLRCGLRKAGAQRLLAPQLQQVGVGLAVAALVLVAGRRRWLRRLCTRPAACCQWPRCRSWPDLGRRSA